MFNESVIIQKLQMAFALPSGAIGIGDDAAVLPLNDKESTVISKDILVENRHFRLSYGDAASLAHKALHVNLSDIAAMGATPTFVMLGIALPPKLSEEWVEAFLTSFTAGCKAQNVPLIGGDTTGSEHDLFISVTVIGQAEKARLKFRSGAKPGDILCVAGALGESEAGLIALERNVAGLQDIKNKSLTPTAKIAEGIWLGIQTGVTAMMDVSDGLNVDAAKLLQASKLGGTINLESLQASPTLVEACATLRLDLRACMLAGGEDYALLLTISPEDYEPVAQAFRTRFGYDLTKIGTITEGSKLDLREGGQTVPFTYRPFSHFGEL